MMYQWRPENKKVSPCLRHRDVQQRHTFLAAPRLEGVDVFLVVDVVVLDFGFTVGFFAVAVDFLTVVEEALDLVLVVDVGFLVVVDLGFAAVVLLVVFGLVVEEAGFGLAAVLEVGLF